MHDALSIYRRKRNFETTPEPRGAAVASGKALSFVIQKHAARSLHYDFRLELDGTLKSWAVPKGPSLDPAQRRMAVHVEDHPLAYGGFEGVIPPNQYGAGNVIVWDRGTWEPVGDAAEGYREGKLKFRLDGEKLHGMWTLVKMHGRAAERQEPWLLIKERDADARSADSYSLVDEQPNSVVSGKGVESVADGAGDLEPAATRSPSPARTAAAKASLQSTSAATRADATDGAQHTAQPASLTGTREPTTPRATKKAKKAPALALPEGAVAAPLPATLEPQLATLVSGAPAGDDWAYEVKFDGYRILARVDGGAVRLLTRNGKDWSAKLAGIARELEALDIGSGWLDGEIVVLNDDGASDFGALQNAFDSGGEQILYFVFDLPYCNGHDLRAVRLEDRRALLAKLLAHAAGQVR
ncbi:MAG: DNA polymerase ligase N-terminal domain-containing protein, partial [Caldimonas sp.]